MTKYIIGEIFSSGRTTLYKNPSDQTALIHNISVKEAGEFGLVSTKSNLFISTYFVIGYWPFGSVFCYIYSSFQGIAILVSSYTLVVISFERYMSILYPLRSVIRGGGGNLYCIVFVLWTVATLASIPNIIQTRHIPINKDNTSENIWVCTSGKKICLQMSIPIKHFWKLHCP